MHAKVVSGGIGGVVGGHELLGKLQAGLLGDLDGSILFRRIHMRGFFSKTK